MPWNYQSASIVAMSSLPRRSLACSLSHSAPSDRLQVLDVVMSNDPKPVPLVEYMGTVIHDISINDQDLAGVSAGMA